MYKIKKEINSKFGKLDRFVVHYVEVFSVLVYY